MKEVLKWHPPTSIGDGLEKTIRWYAPEDSREWSEGTEYSEREDDGSESFEQGGSNLYLNEPTTQRSLDGRGPWKP